MTDRELLALRRRWDRGEIDYGTYRDAVFDDFDLRRLARVLAFDLLGNLVEMATYLAVVGHLLAAAVSARPPLDAVLFGLGVFVGGWMVGRAVAELQAEARKSREIREYYR